MQMQSRPREWSPRKKMPSLVFLTLLLLSLGCTCTNVHANAKANNYAVGSGTRRSRTTGPNATLVNLLSKWRGGAVAASSRSLRKKQSVDTRQLQEQPLPSVHAILIHRRVNLLKVIQFVSLACLLRSLIACASTAGTPLIESIWSELHEGNMPVDYKPSNWDLIVTRHSTHPPPFLPSAQPLLGMLSSLVMYLGLGVLIPKWCSSSYRRRLEFRQVQHDQLDSMSSLGPAAVAVHLPREMRVYADNKALLVCPLQTTDQHKYYFDVCHQRYYFVPNNGTVTFGGPKLANAPIKTLLKQQKGLNGAKLKHAISEFEPYNRIELPTPTIAQAFLTRIASPLVVLQLFGALLAALEHPSLLQTLLDVVQTLLHHYWNARQSIVSARELAQEVQRQDCQTLLVKVKRRGNNKTSKTKWTTLNASALLPGDVFQLANRTALTFPVDALLLRGSAVTNEAILTGERECRPIQSGN